MRSPGPENPLPRCGRAVCMCTGLPCDPFLLWRASACTAFWPCSPQPIMELHATPSHRQHSTLRAVSVVVVMTWPTDINCKMSPGVHPLTCSTVLGSEATLSMSLLSTPSAPRRDPTPATHTWTLGSLLALQGPKSTVLRPVVHVLLSML